MDTMRHIIKRSPPGVGLINLWEVFGDSAGESDREFPSWIYRWDRTVSESSLLVNFNKQEQWLACGDTTQELAEIRDPRILSLKGLKIGVVRVANHILHERTRDSERVQVLWNTGLSELISVPGSDSLKQAFTETITAGEVKTNSSTTAFGTQDLDNYLSITDWGGIYAILDERSGPVSKAVEFLMSIPRKAFLITEDAHMALGPITGRPDDVLCIFFGHHMPYLLRPKGQRYRFLGPCYVHGYMHGEAVKRLKRGELKDEWFELE
jgi:hypothetical protein